MLERGETGLAESRQDLLAFVSVLCQPSQIQVLEALVLLEHARRQIDECLSTRAQSKSPGGREGGRPKQGTSM